MANPTLVQIAPGEKRETLEVREVWSQDAPLAPGVKQIVPIAIDGQDYLLAFDDQGNGSAFRVTAAAPWVEPVASNLRLGGPADIVEPLVLGMSPYLLAYVAEQGTMSIIPINNDRSSRPPYVFSRKRAPVTTGFTVTKPMVVNGLVYVLCYSFTTGDVDMFSLNVTATLAPGAKPRTPPLLMKPVWIHQWAKNWTRFAFFTLGAENFFFKINVGKVNVNIDHILDDPSKGAVEVGTYLQNQLEDPKGVEIVEPFTMGGGDPYFVTYRRSGKAELFRIHSDCQGWTKQAEVDAAKGVTRIVPYTAGGVRFTLFHG
jgi:hypothetical protein